MSGDNVIVENDFHLPLGTIGELPGTIPEHAAFDPTQFEKDLNGSPQRANGGSLRLSGNGPYSGGMTGT